MAVVTLYYLINGLVSDRARGKKVAFVTAVLHVFSPAGIFLSAPYAESVFAAVSFVGYLIYLSYVRECVTSGQGAPTVQADAKVIVAGAILGIATSIRSNGLMNGLLFAYDLVDHISSNLCLTTSVATLRHIACIIIGGLCVAMGYVYPQWLAYQEYCSKDADDGGQRPWCKEYLPSIYSFVQSHYW